MDTVWNWIMSVHDAIYAVMGSTIYSAIIFLAVLGLIPHWTLYY